MNHSKAQARLGNYIDRDLDPANRAVLDAHLDDCSECSLELRELERTVTLLRSLPEPETPPHLASAVLARVADGEGRSSAFERLLGGLFDPRMLAPLTAGVAGLLAFVAIETGRLHAPWPEYNPPYVAERSFPRPLPSALPSGPGALDSLFAEAVAPTARLARASAPYDWVLYDPSRITLDDGSALKDRPRRKRGAGFVARVAPRAQSASIASNADMTGTVGSPSASAAGGDTPERPAEAGAEGLYASSLASVAARRGDSREALKLLGGAGKPHAPGLARRLAEPTVLPVSAVSFSRR